MDAFSAIESGYIDNGMYAIDDDGDVIQGTSGSIQYRAYHESFEDFEPIGGIID